MALVCLLWVFNRPEDGVVSDFAAQMVIIGILFAVISFCATVMDHFTKARLFRHNEALNAAEMKFDAAQPTAEKPAAVREEA